MECSALIQPTLERINAGTVSADDIKGLLTGCPQICEKVYGSANFDLAGPGIYYSVLLQAAFVLLFGTFQSFISYILPPHATVATRITVARLQVLFDTTFRTGILLYFAICATAFVRLHRSAGAYERSMIQDVIDLEALMATLGLIASMVMQQPSKIKMSSTRWGFGKIWPTSQVLIIAGNYAKSAHASAAALTKLCSRMSRAEPQQSYPYVTTPSTGNHYLLLSAAVMAATIFVLVLNEYIRSSIWNFLRKIFTSRISLVVLVSGWTLLTTMCLVFNGWHVHYVRDSMLAKAGSELPQWDFAQVLALAIWLPMVYQLILTVLVTLKLHMNIDFKDAGRAKKVFACIFFIFQALYDWDVGDHPSLEKDDDEKEKCDSGPGVRKPSGPQLEQGSGMRDEKVPLPPPPPPPPSVQEKESVVVAEKAVGTEDEDDEEAVSDEKKPLL